MCVLQGVIVQLQDGEGLLRSEQHGELPFATTENLSDLEFTAADQNEEVEFTVAEVRMVWAWLQLLILIGC